jgi:hypothetical protein
MISEAKLMGIDGIWTAENYGPFGWENQGVYLLEDGRMAGGDNRQYSMGTYELSGDEFNATFLVNYYGPPRTEFGGADEKFKVEIHGQVKDGLIEGFIRRPDKPQFDLQVRMTKRLDVP